MKTLIAAAIPEQTDIGNEVLSLLAYQENNTTISKE